jgi:hypothetical protein
LIVFSRVCSMVTVKCINSNESSIYTRFALNYPNGELSTLGVNQSHRLQSPSRSQSEQKDPSLCSPPSSDAEESTTMCAWTGSAGTYRHDHIINCPHRIGLCPMCEQYVKRCDAASHDVECRRMMRKCDKCCLYVSRANYKQHKCALDIFMTEMDKTYNSLYGDLPQEEKANANKVLLMTIQNWIKKKEN